MALFQTPTERTITSRPFKQLLRYFGYDGSQLSEVGDFAGKELYEVSDYVDKVARPKLVFWSSSGERVERVWLEPAERAVLERLVKHFKVNEKPYTSGDWFQYFCCVYLIGDPGISCILTVTNQTAYAIYKYGDESTKKFLPFLIGESDTLAFGATWFTEIQGGSDLGANLVEARPDGTIWKLKGTKYFCSNAGVANFAIVTARARGAKEGAKGISLFLVPEFDSNGKRNFRVTRLKQKSGTLSVPTGEVEFENSEAFLIGKPEMGIYYTTENLMVSRLSNAMGALGIARKAYLEAYYYAKKRSAFGKKLLEHPLVQRDLIEMEVYIEGTMAITLKAIHEFQKSFKETPPYTERYHYARLLTHIAKNLTADMSSYVTRLAMELHGGIGFLSEFPVERWHREALITPIWEGTSNIQALDMLEAIVKKSAHLPLLKELEDMAIDLKACETHALELYKHAHTRAESTLKSLNALSEEEAQFFAKDVLSELGHALAVATLVHASYRLSSKRLLNVAEVYHEKFVEKKAIGTTQEKERKNIIEIDEGF